MRCALSMTTLALLAIPLEAQDQPTRPPITGIAHVRIYCTDLHKSLDFYSKILGLPPRSGGCTGVSRPCFIINDHQQIGLSQAPSAAPTSLLVEVAFTTTDVAAMRRYLLVHNVPTGTITRDINSLQHFALRDPEGNPIAFVQHPGLQLLTPHPEQAGSRMIHAGFIVKDRAVEDRFYRDLLGFRMYWHGGFKDADNDWWEIQVPDGTDWIEYMLTPKSAAYKIIFLSSSRKLKPQWPSSKPTVSRPPTPPKSAATANGRSTSTIPISLASNLWSSSRLRSHAAIPTPLSTLNHDRSLVEHSLFLPRMAKKLVVPAAPRTNLTSSGQTMC